MEQTSSDFDSLRIDLTGFTALHGISGCEEDVIAHLRADFATLTDEVTIDRFGNLIATRQGPAGAPHIVIAAHADEIGLIVASIEPDGFLRVADFTGVQPRLLEGRQVRVGVAPGIGGVIGARSAHLLTSEQWGRGASLADLYVDVGVSDAASVATLGVRVGDPVVVVSELQAIGTTCVAGKALDNRAGCVVLRQVLRRLQGRALPCHLTVLVTVQEEVGSRGAKMAFAHLQPDLAIVLDTRPAGGTPDTRSDRSLPQIGHGVIVDVANNGYLVPRALREAMLALVERNGIPYQLVLSQNGSSDASAAHAAGIPTLDIGLPRRYAHSPVELLDLRDLIAAIAFVEEIVLHPLPFQPFFLSAPTYDEEAGV
jgi:putative aminopeptidase